MIPVRTRRHLHVVPPPPATSGWNPDRYLAAVFLELAAGYIRHQHLRTVCAAAADAVGTWCGTCIYCHLRAARTAVAAGQPHLLTPKLRQAFAIAVAVAVESDLDTTAPSPECAATLLRAAAHDLYAQALPAEILIARNP